MKKLALWIVAIIPGFSSILICGYYVLVDWASLRRAYANWSRLAQGGSSMRELTIAQSREMALRINVFAEGTWWLLGAILLAIGVYGLCRLPAAITSE